MSNDYMESANMEIKAEMMVLANLARLAGLVNEMDEDGALPSDVDGASAIRELTKLIASRLEYLAEWQSGPPPQQSE